MYETIQMLLVPECLQPHTHPPPKKHVPMLASCCTHTQRNKLITHKRPSEHPRAHAAKHCQTTLTRSPSKLRAELLKTCAAINHQRKETQKIHPARSMTPKCALTVACGARKAGVNQPGRHPCRGVSVGEAGVEWGMCLYWVVRGWYLI